jgi:hypothetical protein
MMPDCHGIPLKPGDAVLIRDREGALPAIVLEELPDNNYRIEFAEEPIRWTPDDLPPQDDAIDHAFARWKERGPFIIEGTDLEFFAWADDEG